MSNNLQLEYTPSQYMQPIQMQTVKKPSLAKEKGFIGIIFLLGIGLIAFTNGLFTPPLTPQEQLDKCLEECNVKEYLATKKHLESQIKDQTKKVDETNQFLLSNISSEPQGQIASGVSEDKTQTETK